MLSLWKANGTTLTRIDHDLNATPGVQVVYLGLLYLCLVLV